MLRDFDNQPSLSNANRFLTRLKTEDFTDEQTFPPGTSVDTLRKQVWYWAGEYYLAAQQYEQAVAYGLRALPLFQKVASPPAEADCEALVATAFFRLGQFNEALSHAKRVVEIDRAEGNSDNISSSLNTLAAIYMAAGQPEEAAQYIGQALSFARQSDNPARLAIICGSASEIHYRLGHYEEAIPFAREALAIEQRLGNKSKEAVRLAQLAPPLIALGKNYEAYQTLQRAIPQLRADSNHHSLAIACNQMGDLLLAENKNAAAATYFQEALDILLRQHDIYNESHSRRGLYRALRDSNPKAAMIHNDRYNELRDSLYDSRTGVLLGQYAALYGNQQLQEENESLRQARSHQLLTIGLAVVMLSLLIWCIGQYRLKRQKQRNTELTEQIARLSNQSNKTLFKSSNTSPQPTAAETDNGDFLTMVIAAVETAIPSRQTDVESIAQALGITSTVFRRRLSTLTGETPKAFISAVLMQRAATLLKQNATLPMAEIATQCGFDEPSNFVRTFKRVYGITPSQYARQNKHS